MKTVMTFGNIVIRIFEYSRVNCIWGHIHKENQKDTMQCPPQFYNVSRRDNWLPKFSRTCPSMWVKFFSWLDLLTILWVFWWTYNNTKFICTNYTCAKCQMKKWSWQQKSYTMTKRDRKICLFCIIPDCFLIGTFTLWYKIGPKP